jgi:radical SAM-linked protein
MRIRIYFHKTASMRYTSHLDLHKTWERTFRRADLPLAYSQGFHPQPRISLACALPLGFTSQAEILDAWLDSDIEADFVRAELDRALPPGIQIMDITVITEREPALQVQVQSAVYEITLLTSVPDLDNRVAKVLAAESLPRERRGKTYDLRPLIESLVPISNDLNQQQRLSVQLAARASATGRPEEVLQVLGVEPISARIHRIDLLLAQPSPQ